MQRVIAVLCFLVLSGCASSKTCIGLLEQAESKYRGALAGVRRTVPEAESDAKWKAALNDFGEVQGLADASQRTYNTLKREDPDRNLLLRKELDEARYFQRFSTVYACSLRMQGIALANLGSAVHADQNRKAADLFTREAEKRYDTAIDCGYPGPKKP